MSDILIVDDERDIRELISDILEDEGYATRLAGNSDEAMSAINAEAPALMVLDIWLKDSRMDGIDILKSVKRDNPDVPVVIISGHGNIEIAVAAIKQGAYDFIEKPFKADRLLLVAERALETSNLKREVTELKKRSGDPVELIGTSVAVSHLKQSIDKIAPTNSRVMILGPSGSGKELVARLIHRKSTRAGGPFVVVNAAAITPERMEVALFGTESAASHERKVGALEEAHGGILYLDEVADMPRGTQSKILRVLVDQQFERVGGTKRVKVDVRILSSTARNLEELIAAGEFREDLYHRLAVVPVRVPSLSERREDIPFLVDMFMRQISEQAGIRNRRIGDDALAVIQAHTWPGNIRQLRNYMERLMILARSDGPETVISANMLPDDVSDMLPKTSAAGSDHIMTLPLREARELFERDYLIAQINRFGGNISRTAEFVGMERSALHRKLKSLGV